MLYRYDVTLDATIMWDGENMLVLQISGNLPTSGICGNNNGIPNDDLVTKQGVPATATDMFISYISQSLKYFVIDRKSKVCLKSLKMHFTNNNLSKLFQTLI